MTALALLEMVAVIAILSVIAYWGANAYLKLRISRELMAHEMPFERASTDTSVTMLVLGDSTGVGVGADKPEDTVAGRLATHVGATWVENYSVSGAEVRDLPKQIDQAQRTHYHYILIQVGGNDILAFHSATEVGEMLGEVLATLPQHDQAYLMSAGNVGGATIFPHPVRPVYTATTLAYHKVFGEVASAKNVTYINLYQPFWKDPFLRDPNRYLSMDGLHPSTYGYGLWFDQLRAQAQI